MTKTKKEMAVIDVLANELIVMPSHYDKLIEVGFETNADLERMERLFALKEKHEANEARKSYHLAMAEFKKIPIYIGKDKKNTQYNSMYTTTGNLINTAAPRLGEFGFSHKWDIEQQPDGNIKVTCVVTHRLGHSDSCSMFAPADKSGAKNAIQQIKSTRTYLHGATFESLLGLASSDINLDDDGNSSRPVEFIDEKQLNTLTDMLNAIGKKETEYCKFKKVAELKDIQKQWYAGCLVDLAPPKAV